MFWFEKHDNFADLEIFETSDDATNFDGPEEVIDVTSHGNIL